MHTPDITLEKRWVNPGYKESTTWVVTLRISPAICPEVFESSDRIIALKYARDMASNTGLAVHIYDRTESCKQMPRDCRAACVSKR